MLSTKQFDHLRAAVRVELVRKRPLKFKVMQQYGVCAVKPGVSFIPIPDNATVVDEQDNILEPTSRYYMTVAAAYRSLRRSPRAPKILCKRE